MQLLIQLELTKFKKIKRYILYCVLITIGMCLFTTISLFAIEQDRAANYNDAIKMMNAAIIDGSVKKFVSKGKYTSYLVRISI